MRTARDTKSLVELTFSPNGVFLIGAGHWYNQNNNKWCYRIFLWGFPLNSSNPVIIPVDDSVEDIVIFPDGQVLVGVNIDTGKLLLIAIVDRAITSSIKIGLKLYMVYAPDINTFAVGSTMTKVIFWSIPPT